ncbi:MAG: DUF3883 domain-containing protein [Muribaculaceae bacterium]|nr:DUF3883 domain-containing protein [Muribaculaceae bacterium]
MKKYYRIPDEFYHRIHFVRPRFKSNIENVLLYMANECCKIDATNCNEYNEAYTKAIRMFPGNLSVKDKTISNWRTEIPALFAFYEEDKKHNITHTSRMAEFLNEQQDLTQFFKFFLYTFQFPGGHLKAKDNSELIKLGIRFKPAKTIIQVLLEGNSILSGKGCGKEMSISAEEATYCIFNDTRVTTGQRKPREIAEFILENRKNKIKYYNPKDPHTFDSKGNPRTKGDVTRYAGDILDYMEIASLVKKHNGYFYLAPDESIAIKRFASDTTFFNGYENLYGESRPMLKQIDDVEIDWFKYVNKCIDPSLFKTDISKFLNKKQELIFIVEDRIKEVINSENTTTKDVGNIGESLIYGHEVARLRMDGYPDLAKLVQIVDSPSYHPGFDIDSFEGDKKHLHRYIEVKTTISKKKIEMYNFHMSSNEWSVAETHREHYCVYRLMLSTSDKVLYILRNPVLLYKTDKISAIPRNGMEISFNASDFEKTELLTYDL